MSATFYEYGTAKPDAPAVTGPDGDTVTYGQLLDRANRGSHLLRSLGVRAGDPVALLCRNGIGYLEVSLGAAQVGIRLVPLNTHLTAGEAAFIVADSGSGALVTDVSTSRLAADLPELPLRLVLGGGLEGFESWDDLLAGQPPSAPADRVHANPILYTSGTSGRPKGVLWPPSTQPPEAVATAVEPLFSRRGMTHGEHVTLVTGPLYHGAPGSWALQGLHHGHHVVVMDGWDSEGFLELVGRHRVTTAQLAPIHFSRLLALPAQVRASYDTSSLQTVSHAGAPTPVAVKEAMIDWWGPVLVEYYASSEGFGTSITSEEWLQHKGSVGAVGSDGCRMEIRDDDGEVLVDGAIGQVWIRNPGGVLTSYTRTSAAPPTDGFYSAGDLGRIEDGWLYLVDRRTDLILSGGVNVYPAEVEQALLGVPEVADAAVVGVPDAEWGARVVAVVVPAAGAAPGEAMTARILEAIGPGLARFKLPKQIVYRDALPYSPVGKVLRRVLRAELS